MLVPTGFLQVFLLSSVFVSRQKTPLVAKFRTHMFSTVTFLASSISMPLLAMPKPPGSCAFLPSRIVFFGVLPVPVIVSPLNFEPSRITPSTYLPGLTLIFSIFLSLPALLTAFWILLYLQPCSQTVKAVLFFFLPARAEAGTASIATARNAVAMRTIRRRFMTLLIGLDCGGPTRPTTDFNNRLSPKLRFRL